ncbi:TusE/DsrC/DsvC family sulfur relay protein [Allohahella marinimesophila]|uniref:Sulfurtransferase n=1 Tax=Allohahella marinimesophila TaxID=1054972 RepID=A0ABP7NLP0_9GAMM
MSSIPGVEPQTDKEGFLRNIADWSETVARQLAQQSDIELERAHLELLLAARTYYELYGQAPLARSFVRYLQQSTPEFSSMSLMHLFPPSSTAGSSIKQICRMAGLPKPPGCL